MEFHIGQNKKTCVIPAGYFNRAEKRLIKRGKGWKVPGYAARLMMLQKQAQTKVSAQKQEAKK